MVVIGPEPTLPEVGDPPRHYRIPISRIGKRWITANQRLHPYARARMTAQWRDVTAWRCRQMPEVFDMGARIICELRFHGKRRRDPANWAPTAKACVDGLVDALLFPDDNHKYVTGPDMRLGPPAASKDEEEIVIHILPFEVPR